VLAEVNGEPIFADKVLATVEKVLAAYAQQLDERQFRRAAAAEIDRQIAQFVNDELEYAMAKNRLDRRDADLATLATIRWRDEQIAQAGGSLELARQRARAAGYEFEELQKERERWFMRKLYYEKREYPKLQVSATDLRRYYQEHQRTEFTTPDRARFRVIKVDQRKAGGRDAALAEVNRLLELVRGGKDFAELAAEDNDEESFKRPVEWFQRGAFAVKAVEDAVWQIQPGGVTEPVETPEAFYIAKLDVREPGGVRAFDGDVQERISTILKERQFAALRGKIRQALKDDAIIRSHPRMVELAVEMAMQKYRFWRGAAQAQ
jgi:parvulin-like peptidyl-prolyl isomerase